MSRKDTITVITDGKTSFKKTQPLLLVLKIYISFEK